MEDNNEVKPEDNIQKEEDQVKENSEMSKEQPFISKEEKQDKKEEKKEEKKDKKSFFRFFNAAWYDKHYKKLLLVWIIISLLIIGQLVFMALTTGDIMTKDVTLTGGTSISVYTNSSVDTAAMTTFLQSKLPEKVFIRTLNDLASGKQIAFVVETKADANLTKTALEEYLGYSLDSSNSTTEVSGSNLSNAFYKQLLIALALAFIFMGITVFIIFKVPIPSLAVIQCGIFDTLGALVIANIFGVRMSTAGIAALLMLAGYSVDTDIVLTTKVLKRKGEGTIHERMKSAFKTGFVMTITALVSTLAGYFIVTSPVLKQIFFVLSAGLFVDLLGTWIGNAAIIKWYCEKKGLN